MPGKELRIDDLKELLEREIAELEERLQLYQALLNALEECSAAAALRVAGGRGKEFRDREGRLVAKLIQGRDAATLMFYVPVPMTHPYVKYMLTALERLQEENEGLDINVEKDDDSIRIVTVEGLNKDNIDDVIAVLEFAAKKIANPRRRITS